MIKLIISGACGKMGQRIITNAVHTMSVKVVGAVEHPHHPQLGQDIGLVLGLGNALNVRITDTLDKIIHAGDVLIEFTNPETTLDHLGVAVYAKKPMVIGTTGFSTTQLNELRNLGQQIPCVFSPNMSLGVNLLFKLVEQTAKTLGAEFDIEIVESHHRGKKDAPSGTANKLADIAAQALGRTLSEVAVFGRKGITGERTKEEIGIHAVRGGDMVGEHTVYFCGIGERIELTHRASSRDTFALGAIRAAKFIVDKPAGIYDMLDVLGLRK
ncbi:MAG: 4-hydroxy-tetrahydrodipicolinate reductase [bacterium]|nr:4-hydroxy-tetrahydrodipicolinate reductase [bacterium]